jgi:hypothetical protein
MLRWTIQALNVVMGNRFVTIGMMGQSGGGHWYDGPIRW